MDDSSCGDLRPLLLVTAVDIAKGQSATIELREGDDVWEVAGRFCSTHGLPETVLEPLVQHLNDNLQALLDNQPASPSYSSQGEEEEDHRPLHPDGISTQRHDGAWQQQQRDSATRKLAGGSTASVACGSGTQYGLAPPLQAHDRLYGLAQVLRDKQEQKRRQRQASFDEDARRSSANPASRRMMAARNRPTTAGSSTQADFGERLYADAHATQQRKQQAARQRQEEKSRAEVAGATFRPRITKMAQQLQRGEDFGVWHGNPASVKPWQRLARTVSGRTLARMETLRREDEARATRGCTFRPQLCQASRRLVDERRSQTQTAEGGSGPAAKRGPHYESLYEDAARRLQKQQAAANQLPEELTFKPQLIASYRPRSADSTGRWDAYSHSWHSAQQQRKGAGAKPVEDRLYERWSRSQQRLEEARRAADGPVDPDTGRQRFQPSTGRHPSIVRNSKQLPVGEYLYLQGQQSQTRRERQLRELEEEQQQEADRKKMLSSSEVLHDRLKQRRFVAIFEYLSQLRADRLVELAALAPGPLRSDEGEALAEGLDVEVRSDVEAAARLFLSKQAGQRATGCGSSMGVEGSGAEQDDEEEACRLVSLPRFCELMEKVMVRFRGPRSYLVPTPGPKTVWDDGCTFHPAILTKSKAMAAALRPSEHPIHDLLYADAAVRSSHHVQRVQQAEAEQRRVCTFKPRLPSDKLPAEGKALRMAECMASGRLYNDDLRASGASSSAIAAMMMAARSAPHPLSSGEGVGCASGSGLEDGGASSSLRPGAEQAPLSADAKQMMALEEQVRQALAALLEGDADGMLGGVSQPQGDAHSPQQQQQHSHGDSGGPRSHSCSVSSAPCSFGGANCSSQNDVPLMASPTASSSLSSKVLASTLPEVARWQQLDDDVVVDFHGHHMGMDALQQLAAACAGRGGADQLCAAGRSSV